MRPFSAPDASEQKYEATAAPQPQLANMQKQFCARLWPILLQLASQTAAQWPCCPATLRYQAIAGLMTNHEHGTLFARAAALGDKEALRWQSAVQTFSHYPAGSFTPEDLCQHVAYLGIQNSAYMEYPSEVTLETQAVCNARCVFCPYGTMQRKGERMPDSLLAKVLDDLTQIPQHVPFTISPFKLSDPFLDKRIFSVCETINRTLPQAGLRLFSNGTPLSPKIIEKTARIRKVEHLWISLNEYEPEAYHAVMRLPFALTIANLDHLHAAVQQGYPHPVHISRVGDNSERDKAFAAFVHDRYPLFAVSVLTRGSWSGQVDTPAACRIPATPCVRWFELSIMASGKVALCCQDGTGEHVIGDVNANSVLEVYNSPDYKKLRQYTVSRLGAPFPCNKCRI